MSVTEPGIAARTSCLLADIRLDDRAQPRISLDTDRIAEYADDMLRGDTFPPLIVFEDEQGALWLADGFHRYYAAVGAGAKSVECDVRPGGLREAILLSCGATLPMACRRTNADKRASVSELLTDEEWRAWSDREIAKRCSVGANLVGRVREELRPLTVGNDSKPRTYRTKHGTIAKMQVGKGKAKSGPAPALRPPVPAAAEPSPFQRFRVMCEERNVSFSDGLQEAVDSRDEVERLKTQIDELACELSIKDQRIAALERELAESEIRAIAAEVAAAASDQQDAARRGRGHPRLSAAGAAMSRAFAAQKFSWLERVTRDHDLRSIDVQVASALARYFTEKDQGGRAYPAYKTLGSDIGSTEYIVIGAVRRLHARGHLRVTWGKAGRGHVNQYWMADEKPLPDGRKKTSPEERFSDRENLSDMPIKPLRERGEPLKNPDERGHCVSPSHLREREAEEREAPAALSSLDGGGGADARHAADEPKPVDAPPLTGEILPPDERNTLPTLVAFWNRGHLQIAPPPRYSAFAPHGSGHQGGGGLDDLRRRAQGGRAADAPRFLDPVDHWLDARGWQSSPPPKRRTSRTGSRTPRSATAAAASRPCARLETKTDEHLSTGGRQGGEPAEQQERAVEVQAARRNRRRTG